MGEDLYKPNYTITEEILNLVASIVTHADVLTVHSGMKPSPKLMRLNRLRSFH